MFRKNKKGNQLMTYGVGGVLALFIIAVIVFALAYVGGAMNSSTSDTTAKSVIANFTAGTQTFAGLSSVMWIILAVGVILLVLFSAIGWLVFGKMGRG